MLKKIIIALMAFIFYSGTRIEASKAYIIVVDSVRDPRLQEIAKNSSVDDQFVFDCDGVLIDFCDKILKQGNRENFLIPIVKNILAQNPSITNKIPELFHRVECEARLELLDEGWPEFIQRLQKEGKKTILLSACDTGEPMKKLRYEQLLQFNISFEGSFPDKENVRFEDFSQGDEAKPGLFNKNFGNPVFSNGMLLSGKIKKGPALKKFLLATKQLPKRIILFDDLEENLISVKEIADELGIGFIGILFKKDFKLSEEEIREINKIAEKQFEILIKESRWIPDHEAHNLLQPK